MIKQHGSPGRSGSQAITGRVATVNIVLAAVGQQNRSAIAGHRSRQIASPS